jgi:hypothetical protein
MATIGITRLDPSYFAISGPNLISNGVFNGNTQKMWLLNQDVFSAVVPIGTDPTAAWVDATLTTITTANFSFDFTKITRQTFIDAGMADVTLEADILNFVNTYSVGLFSNQTSYNILLVYPNIAGIDYVVALVYPGNDADP